jgi:hypothetical protein
VICRDEEIILEIALEIAKHQSSLPERNVEYQTKNGELIPVRISSLVIENKSRDAIGVVIIGEDRRLALQLKNERMVRERAENTHSMAQADLGVRIQKRTDMTPESKNPFNERRRFSRVKVPVYCRPAGFLKPRQRIGNISLGGLRVYTDEFFKIGDRREIEIFLPDNQSIVEIVRVVWIKELPTGSNVLYDVALEFLRLSSESAHRHLVVLDTIYNNQ